MEVRNHQIRQMNVLPVLNRCTTGSITPGGLRTANRTILHDYRAKKTYSQKTIGYLA